MAFESYRKLVLVLKRKCPPAYPITVRRVAMTSHRDGDCWLKDCNFYIRVNRELPEPLAIETLLHEWAHARAWSHLHDSLTCDEFEERSHDASWGVAYSEVYRVYEQCFLPIVADKKCSKYRPK